MTEDEAYKVHIQYTFNAVSYTHLIKPMPIRPTTIMIFLIFLLSSIDFSFELVLSSIIHSVITVSYTHLLRRCEYCIVFFFKRIFYYPI